MDRKTPNTYSYADYLQWPEEKLLELIEGAPYMMTPSPSRQHQKIVLELGRQFANFLKGKTCEVNIAPFDVRLSEKVTAKDDEVFTVVQPDLVVVCNKSKLDDRGCNGAPDLIIEVISPSNAAHDYITKMNLYEKSAVKEYWIVHPVDQIVMVYYLEDGKYGRPLIFDHKDKVDVKTVSELEIDLEQVFD